MIPVMRDTVNPLIRYRVHSGYNKDDTVNDVRFCTFKSPIKKNNPIFFTQLVF